MLPQDVDGQQTADHGGEGDDERVEADGGQGGHDLVVCPQLRPQRDDEEQKGRGLKAPQPGHGAGLDGGAGAQEGPQDHQSQIEREIQKGAGQLLQGDQLSFQRIKGRPDGSGHNGTMIPQRWRKVQAWMCGGALPQARGKQQIASAQSEAFLCAGAVVQ